MTFHGSRMHLATEVGVPWANNITKSLNLSSNPSRPRAAAIRQKSSLGWKARLCQMARFRSLTDRWCSYVSADHREMGPRDILVFLLSAAVLSSAAIVGIMSAAGWGAVTETLHEA